jgi:hypothetical protein
MNIVAWAFYYPIQHLRLIRMVLHEYSRTDKIQF